MVGRESCRPFGYRLATLNSAQEMSLFVSNLTTPAHGIECQRLSTPRQRIAIFLPALAGGGAERAMVNLAGGFVRRGVAVDMVLGVVEGPYLADLDPEVRVLGLGAVGAVAKTRALVRYLKRERPLAVISALDNINLAAIARRIAGVNTRVVINVQNNLSADLASLRGFKGWMRRRMMRVCYPMADVLTCVSSGVADDLAATVRLAQGQAKVVYNPVQTERIEQLADEPVAHPWLNDANVPLLLAVGRLTKQKDYPTLVRAFAKLVASRQARLMILGEGEDRHSLQRLVDSLSLTQQVELHGFVKNPYAYMSRASVFVMSSAWEGLPTVMIEAMACGAAVVSTDCPSGPHEILDGGRYGSLVPVGDADALAAALAVALDEPHARGLSLVRASEFTAEKAVEKYLKLFGIGSASSEIGPYS